MIKHILVPMGGSAFSAMALKTGVNLANRLNADLRLLYVEDTGKIRDMLVGCAAMGSVSLDVPSCWVEGEGLKKITEEMEKEKSEVERLYNSVREEIKGNHELVIRSGSLADEIVKDIRSTDLVIMGKSLKASETECQSIPAYMHDIIRKSTRPILTLCEKDCTGGRIVVAYDGSRSSINALRILGDILPASSGTLLLVSVRKTIEETLPLLDEAALYFAPYGMTVEKISMTGNAAENILAVAEKEKASLIVMGGYGDNKIKEFLMGSTTEKVLKAVTIPVLLCNS